MSTSDTKTAMDHAYDALEGARARRRKMEDRRAELQNQLADLRREATVAADDLRTALQQYAAGALPEDAVAEVRKNKEAAEKVVADTEELLDALLKGRPQLAAAEEQQRLDVIRAREQHALAASDSIAGKVGADKKIRKALVQAFAVLGSARDPQLGGPVARTDWDLFILDIFEKPTEAEYAEAYDEMRRTYFGEEPDTDAAA